jgi:hypothetical protein
MRYAIIQDSKVVNVIEADEINANAIAAGLGAIAIQSDAAGISDKYIDGQIVKLTAAEIEAQRQTAKPLKLKEAENAFLALVSTVPGVVAGDNSDALTAKIEAAEALTETQKISLGLKLLNAIHEVELQGGSWYDLPESLHVFDSY